MKTIPRLALACSVALLIGSGTPATGASEASRPDPLRRDARLVVQDIAARFGVVGVGWREGQKPGRLLVAFSKDGGASFLKNNGNLRKFNTLGLPGRGLSLDICGPKGERSIWIGTAMRQGRDDAGDADVLLTRRSVRSPIRDAYQAFLTSPSRQRSVRSVDVACIGNEYLAIAWLEKLKGRTRARLMIRDQASFGTTDEVVSKVFNLGEARFWGGISVAANARGVHVAWVRGSRRHLRIRTFLIEGDDRPPASPQPAVRLAWGDIARPQVATSGSRVIVAYSDAGKVRARLSLDRGASFGSAIRLVGSGSRSRPSRVHSIDLSGRSIVVEATRREGATATPQRLRSDDLGATWSTRSFGHRGTRVGALQSVRQGAALLTEAWHHDGRSGDTLRVWFEE